MTTSYNEYREIQRATTRRCMKRLYDERRDNAIETYGGKCAVCGNNNRPDLSIVPKKGWHWAQTAVGRPIRDGRDKLRWLDENDYPDSHTVVCGPAFSRCRRALQLVD